MNRIALYLCLAAVFATLAVGCSDGKPKKLDVKNFDGRFGHCENEGDVLIEVENKSNYDLKDVNIDVTVDFGEDQQTLKVKQHWDVWKNGELKKLIAGNCGQPVNYWVCKAVGEGTSKDFMFSFVVRIKKEF